MRNLQVAWLVALSGSVAACSSPEDKAVAAMEGMAEVFAANEGDCDAMAKALDEFQAANATELESLRQILGKSDEDRADFDAKYKARTEAALGKVLSGALACMENDAVTKAMKAVEKE